MPNKLELSEKRRHWNRRFSEWLSKHYKQKRYAIISLSVIILLLIYFFKDASFLLRAVSAVSFLFLFYAVDHYFDIRLRWEHYAFIILIAIGSFLLSPLYYIHPQYDKFQHFIQPILVSSIVFYMISKLEVSLKWKIFFTVFTVISILTMFEMSEYALDRLFDWKLQGVYLRDVTGLQKLNLVLDPLDDTIYDLLYGTLGSCLYGAITFIYMRLKSKTF